MTEDRPQDRPLPKSAWGPGPWQDEPDHVEWRHAGLPCLAHRNWLGAWCGYAAVPPGHPLHGVAWEKLPADVDVHSGLNYSQACEGSICHVPAPGEPDDVWWIGFDCAHAFDYCPEMAASFRQDAPGLALLSFLDAEQYRTLAYVTEQTNLLAEQLAARSGTP